MLRRILKWIGIALGGVLALVLLAFAFAFFYVESVLNKQHDVPAHSVVVPTDSAAIAEGKRLATIRGCYGGCHGPEAEGEVMFDEPLIARAVAPSLAYLSREYTPAQFERAVRHGVVGEGNTVLIMPSIAFTHMSDEDLGTIIAFLRSLPEDDGPLTEMDPRAFGYFMLTMGFFQDFTLAPEEIDHAAPHRAFTPTDTLALGEYLAMSICSLCHGSDLRGGEGMENQAPNLSIAAAFSLEGFTQVLREGIGLGDRELNEMKEAAESFKHFTDDEIAALHAYLSTLPPEHTEESGASQS